MRINLNETHNQDGFRSRLESEVAAELDRHGIHWAYEQPWTRQEDGYTPSYLPDFTIDADSSTADLGLPRWVEAKPQQMIYDLFTTFGLNRSVGERFDPDDPPTVYGPPTSAETLKARHVEELWKPKLLAELSGQCVLVVGAVGATERLSVEMRPSEIVFSRSHPFVNSVGVARRAEQERRRAQAALDAEYWRQQRAHLERQRQRDQERELEAHRQAIRQAIASATRTITPQFASRCESCREYGDDGRVYMIQGQWRHICQACLQ